MTELRLQRARVERLLKRWAGPLSLSAWHLEHHFVTNPDDIPSESGKTGDVVVPAALTDVSWEYAHGSIVWNLPVLHHMSEEQLELCVVHELMHVLVNEMRADGRSQQTAHVNGLPHEERVCTMLARAFIATRALT